MTTASGRPEAAQRARRSALLQPQVKPARKFFALGNSLISLVFLLSVIATGCAGGDPKPNSARANVAQVVPVSVATAERRDMPYYLTGLGSVTAYYTVSVKSRVDGQLMQVNFQEGQTVKQRRSSCRDRSAALSSCA